MKSQPKTYQLKTHYRMLSLFDLANLSGKDFALYFVGKFLASYYESLCDLFSIDSTLRVMFHAFWKLCLFPLGLLLAPFVCWNDRTRGKSDVSNLYYYSNECVYWLSVDKFPNSHWSYTNDREGCQRYEERRRLIREENKKL